VLVVQRELSLKLALLAERLDVKVVVVPPELTATTSSPKISKQAA